MILIEVQHNYLVILKYGTFVQVKYAINYVECEGPFALDDNDVIFVIFFLSSGVNSNTGNHATQFKRCADDIKSLFHRHQVRTGPSC